ncbi:hypothetical protein OIU34_16950 [Pararhizobium sp. BT-229]|uniref:hypothetical protein n=1 Tax=Pararhizobium sp. BT-229 TaxID=2986923 RepID=UPI0021F79CC0|nr:hypothetical protein [Pararhizobium sp. BT-229]MCV9963589.1 hypothetical protein [Pararhizobium sp. BT-229]
MIREMPATAAETGGGQLAATLSLFSHAFSRLEDAGLIVREFPKANDTNIWIFGYLLEAVQNAATVEKFERRHFDHARLLADIAAHLEWAGHTQAVEVVRTRMLTASNEARSGEAYEALLRHAHMRRFASFAWGVVLEMHRNGIWPSHDDIEVYRQAHTVAVIPGDTPSFLLDIRDLVADIAREVAAFDAEAATRIEGFRAWKRTSY